MKSLGDIIKKQQTLGEVFRHPRQRFLDEAFKLINAQRVTDGYKPLAIKVIAIKTAHLNDMDLDFLLKRMRASATPARVFFGSLKVKKEDKT